MRRYEINSDTVALDCAPEQGFLYVRSDDQIRTGESAQRIDSRRISPGGSNLAAPYSVATALVVSAAVFPAAGWLVVYSVVLVPLGLWAWRGWAA